MVKRTINAITSKINGLQEAAFWLSLFAFFSQILAFLRDRLLAHHFGASVDLDIYYAAFKIPDIIFVTVASFVSISALVPLFAKKETEGERRLKEATDSVFTVFFLIIILSCALAWILMPYAVPLFFGSLGGDVVARTILLSRMLLLSPALLGLSNFFGAIVQYEKRFILYSVSPILYNIGIVSGIVFGVEDYGITGAVIGVIFGACMHLFLQASFVFLSPARPSLVSRIKWDDVMETAKLSVPRTLALSVTTFVGFLFASLASRLEEGSISIFNLAFNLQSAPVSLIGASFSLAAFPSIAVSYARGKIPEVVEKISVSLRQIILWSLPATSIIIILRAHIVRVVLGSGNFDWNATRLTAAVLALFVISAVFQSFQLFLSRAHYALGNTKWPLLGNILGGLTSVSLAILFITGQHFWSFFFVFLESLLDISGLSARILSLPLAYSIGSIVSVVTLLFAFGGIKKELWAEVRGVVAPSFLSSISSAIVCYFMLFATEDLFNLETFFGILGQGSLAGFLGIATGATVLYLLKNTEARELVLYATKNKKF